MNCPETIVVIHLNLQTKLRLILSTICDTSSITSFSYNIQYFLYFMIENVQRTQISNTLFCQLCVIVKMEIRHCFLDRQLSVDACGTVCH